MDYNKIKILLDKYFEGETSLEEEALLETYFGQPDIATELQKYQPLFRYLEEEKTIDLTVDLEEKVIGQLTDKENIDGGDIKKKHIKRWIAPWFKIAAAILLMIGGYTIYLQQQRIEPVAPAIDKFAAYDAMTEQEAYERTKAALMLISNKLNKGTSQAKKSLSTIKEATEKIK
jgi:hypothetical protein